MTESDPKAEQESAQSSAQARPGEPIIDDVIVAVLHQIKLDHVDEIALGVACNQAAEKYGAIWAGLKQDAAGCSQSFSHAINNLMSAGFLRRVGISHDFYITERTRGLPGQGFYKRMSPELQAQIDVVASAARG